MSSVIISDRLSKRYRIDHQARNDTLRDALSKGAAGFWKLLRGMSSQAQEDFWALREASFEVRSGEVLGVIGRNGAGKSTLLKILSRITEPTEGRVEIRGRTASLLEVGTGFHPELTGRENIFLNGAILGMSRAEILRKFDEIVAFAEVERFLDTPVKRYSSGMYVRLAFAVAAHLEPEILIIDEVLAVGDFSFQAKCLGKMEQVAHSGERTVIFVSHNLGAISSLCDRVLLLEGGKVIAEGPPEDITPLYLGGANMVAQTTFDVRPEAGDSRAGHGVKLEKIEFLGSGEIQHREPLTVRMHYDASSPARAAFGLGFCTSDGVRICTYDSDIDGEVVSLSPGKGSIDFHLAEFPLGPGHYLLDAGIRSGAVSSLDYLPGFGAIEVRPGPRTHPGFCEFRTGGLRMPAKWLSERH